MSADGRCCANDILQAWKESSAVEFNRKASGLEKSVFDPGSLFFKENYYKDAELETAGRNLENTVAKLEAASWMPCKCSHLSVTFCQADDRKKDIIAAKWINVETWVVFKTGATGG